MIVVVGAGIFGVTAALELARRGRRVTLVDPGPVPHPLAESTDLSKVVRCDYGADELYTDLGERALEGWRRWNAAPDRADPPRGWDRPRPPARSAVGRPSVRALTLPAASSQPARPPATPAGPPRAPRPRWDALSSEVARSFYARLDSSMAPVAQPAARIGITISRRFERRIDHARE